MEHFNFPSPPYTASREFHYPLINLKCEKGTPFVWILRVQAIIASIPRLQLHNGTNITEVSVA